MLTLKRAVVGDDISKYAGVYTEALTDYPPNGRLPIDGSLVKIATFPKLFATIGHLYTSGSKAGNGSEGNSFKLPLPAGRFFKPRDDGSNPGALTEDRTSNHTHSASTSEASHGSHVLQGVPYIGGPYGLSHKYIIPPEDDGSRSWRGTYSSWTGSTDRGGDHNHTFSVGAGGDAETRPFSVKMPTYIVTGELSDTCVAIVYGKDWATTPGYNEVIPAKTGIELAFACENIHTFRIRHPEVAGGVATLNTAHIEVARQLKLLRTKYRNVWILGIGTGAHLAAMAMTAPNLLWVANKMVGINGVYDLNPVVSATLAPAITAYLGGVTPDLKAKGTPIKPYYPVKCWHGANNAVIPSSQSTAWTANTVIVPNLPHDSNPITAGLFSDILTFFKS